MSSEKIERWASVASFSHAHSQANGGRGVRNIRVHSEESLMTMILPTTMNSKVMENVQPELASSTRSLLSNGNSNSRNGSIKNGNGLHPDSFRPANEENGLKLLP